MINLSIFKKIEDTVDYIACGVAIFGGFALLIAAATTCVSIILKIVRRASDAAFGQPVATNNYPWLKPILGEEEIVQFLVGFALFSALPLVMVRRENISVDIFEPYFGKKTNQLLDFIGDALFTWVAWMIMTRQWGLIFKKTRKNQESMPDLLLNLDFAGFVDRIRDRATSQILNIPMWPIYAVAELFVVLFFLAIVFCSLRSLLKLTSLISVGKS